MNRLGQLEDVAHAADNGSPWEWEHAYPQRISRVGDVVIVAECFEDPDRVSRFAEFIATFDPPTVLALIEIIKAARTVSEIEQTGVLPDFQQLATALSMFPANGDA